MSSLVNARGSSCSDISLPPIETLSLNGSSNGLTVVKASRPRAQQQMLQRQQHQQQLPHSINLGMGLSGEAPPSYLGSSSSEIIKNHRSQEREAESLDDSFGELDQLDMMMGRTGSGDGDSNAKRPTIMPAAGSGVFILDKNCADTQQNILDDAFEDAEISGRSGKSTPATSSQSQRGACRRARKPVGMQRAKVWSPEVENAFRYQLAGFRDMEEYLTVADNTDPEYWLPEGLIKCLKAKKTGYFMYFRRTRECEDKFLNRIILYQY